MDDELIEIAIKMAQELQDFVGDAQESGSDLPGTKALIEEWETAYQKQSPWQKEIANLTDEEGDSMPYFLCKQAD